MFGRPGPPRTRTRPGRPPIPRSTATTLDRTLGLIQATALVVGIIIGASIFVQPSEMMREVPTVGGIFLVWVAAGLLTAAGALICAELASAWPESGGVYVYLRRTLSPAVGFLWAWAMFWSMHSGIIAAIGMVFGRYTSWFLPWGDAAVRPLAVGAILLVSAVNYVGVRHGGRLHAAFTLGKLLAIAVMIVAAFALGGGLAETGGSGAASTAGSFGPSGAGSPSGSVGAFLRAVAAGLFAFGGWHMVTYTAGETVDAPRTIPRALVLGIATVVLCYVALNAAYLHVLPVDVVVSSDRVAADAADAVLGSGGAGFMAGLVGFSAFGALAGLVLAGPRVYHSMAEDGLLFRWVAAVHPRYRTPHRAIVLQAAWSCVLVATGTYRELFTRVIYTEWIFFALLAVGLLLARREPGWRPAWRVPGGALVPILFIAGSAGVVVNSVASQPAESAVGLALVLVGLPVFLLREVLHARRRLP